MLEKLVVMKEDGGNITKETPIILAKDVNEKCYALKPEDHLSHQHSNQDQTATSYED